MIIVKFIDIWTL